MLRSRTILKNERSFKGSNPMASTVYIEKMDQLNGNNGIASRTRNTVDRIVRGKTSASQSSLQQPSNFRDVSNKKHSILMMINGDSASGPLSTKHQKKAHRQVNSLTDRQYTNSNQALNYKTVAEASSQIGKSLNATARISATSKQSFPKISSSILPLPMLSTKNQMLSTAIRSSQMKQPMKYIPLK